MSRQSDWRYTFLSVAFLGFGLLVVAQVVRFQFLPEAQLIANLADERAGEDVVLYPARGQIYDRWGHLLAGNKTVYEVGVNLKDVVDPRAIALTVSAVLDLDYDQVYQRASVEYDPNEAVYIKFADFVPADKALLLQELVARQHAEAEDNPDSGPISLSGLTFREHLGRSYPEDDLAANVLGFVSQDGQGYFGVEEYYDDLLTGTPLSIWLPSDPNRVEELPEIPPGDSLILTIDREIQASVEAILDQAVEDTGARTGVVIVMDPVTGEIYAMATTPRVDLNEYFRYTEVYPEKTPFNQAISKAYEPGSVFKILTMAAALDADAVEPDTPFLDTGSIEVGGIIIHNWNNAAWGPQDMQGCLQHSLNVCLAWVSTELGVEKFYDYMDNFGIGHLTGIDLAGEVYGRLKTPTDSDWYPADLGANSFGQGVAVTPIQMLMAASAIINDGKMVTPHVLKALISDGTQYNIPYQYVSTPISAETAQVLNQMLTSVVQADDSLAYVAGYQLAGKTGTAQIPAEEGGYKQDVTNTSFIGWGPVDDPQFLVYVWLEEPSSSIWGSLVAAPVFADVVERLVVLLDLPPDVIRLSMLEQ